MRAGRGMVLLGWHVWARRRSGQIAIGAWRARPIKYVSVNFKWQR
jgi:hypothetical protein